MHRRVTVRGQVSLSKEGGKSCLSHDVAEKIEEASYFAEVDPYRAVTANKGVMNGIDAVLLATGQDFRAVEAAAHAFASRNGRYTALAQWRVQGEKLVGTMDIPLALGTVGGITAIHPIVSTSLKILNIQQANRLAELVASVGLAQNLAATRALASEGIQRGHMRLHSRNIAMLAGARPDEVPLVVSAMLAQGRTDEGCASECLKKIRNGASDAQT
jgi:hydroxymethylglutaryl-CoA reductase